MSAMDDNVTFVPQGKLMSVQAPVQGMTVTIDHVWIALADGGVEVRHGQTAKLVHRFESAPRPTAVTRIWSLLAVPISAKSSHVWMGLSSGVIEVYDDKSFLLLRKLNKHAGGVYCLAEFGGFVYSGSSDFQIAQWYARDGLFVRLFRGHASYVRCLYAEGSAVVSGSDDCTVRVWDAGSGGAQLTGHFHGRAAVSALCRVGLTMWSGDNEGRVIAWKLGTCEALRVLQTHGGRVMSLRKIGSRVYSGGADGAIAVLDAEDGQLVQRIDDHADFRLTTVQCVWECSRYSVWGAMSDNAVQCRHHDEQRPMTSTQERLNDMRWYYSTLLPHHEVNEQILKQHRELSELVVLSEGGDNAVRQMLSMNEEIKNNSLLKCWSLVEQIKESEKETHAIQEERAKVQAQVERGKQNLKTIRGLLERTVEALQKARGSRVS